MDAIRDAVPEEPGVIRRFVAALDENGQVTLPIGGVDLRITTSNDEAGHSRTFLPETVYQQLNLDVIRKADGTAFFIVNQNGVPLDSGQYRLVITYRRDNRRIDPDSPVLSEADNTGDEIVTIDIPRDPNPEV